MNLNDAEDIAARLQGAVQVCVSQLERAVESCLDHNATTPKRALIVLQKLKGYCQFVDAPNLVLYGNEVVLLMSSFFNSSVPSQIEVRRRLLCLSVLRFAELCKRIDRVGVEAKVDAKLVNELRVANGKKALFTLNEAEIEKHGNDRTRSVCVEHPRAFSCLLATATNAAALLNKISYAEKSAVIESDSELSAVLISIDSISRVLNAGNSAKSVADVDILSDCPEKVALVLASWEVNLTYVLRFKKSCHGTASDGREEISGYLSALAGVQLIEVLKVKLKELIELSFDSRSNRFFYAVESSVNRKIFSVITEILLFSQKAVLVLSNFLQYQEYKSAASEFIKIEAFFRNFMTWWKFLVRKTEMESSLEPIVQRANKTFLLYLVRAEATLQVDKYLLQSRHWSQKIANDNWKEVSIEIDRIGIAFESELRKYITTEFSLNDGSRSTLEKIDSENSTLIANISQCLKAWRVCSGIHYIGEAVCTAFYKLSMNLLFRRQLILFQAVASLHCIFTTAFERQSHADQNVCVILEGLMSICCDIDRFFALSENGQRQKLHALDVMISCTAASQAALEGSTTLSVYLASSIHELLIAPASVKDCLQKQENFHPLSRRLVLELRMLASGARALRVYRIERLSSVLAEVHQHLAGVADEDIDINALELLTNAHDCLRNGLNQAAARQEVGNPQEVIAGLYRWLEDNSRQPRGSDSLFLMDFQREAEELMSRLETNATVFLSNDASVDRQVESRTALLQCLHTLKGSAGFFDCDRISTLCHRCETSLLDESGDTQVLAVAEYAEVPVYITTGEMGRASHDQKSRFEKIFCELRFAVDSLHNATRQARTALTNDLHTLPVIPVGSADKSSVTIPAQGLQRIAELASLSRTLNRSLCDVLQSLHGRADIEQLAVLAELIEEQGRCAAQLDEEIDGSKTISFARVTPRLLRLAGRFGNKLDKQIQFNISNDDLRMDRALVERLIAPLEHLLRNAIDHGIETVPLRRARGKPDAGSISLSITLRTIGIVNIELHDDGNGIDTANLMPCAMRLGIENAQTTAPQDRLLWLLQPGFSTRVGVCEEGGHGIGLAAVNHSVTALGGRLEIESTPGCGSCFRLWIPV